MPLLILLLALLAVQVAPARAQDTRVILQQDSAVLGATRVLNCVSPMACTYDTGTGIGNLFGGGGGGLALGMLAAIDQSTTNVTVSNTLTETPLYSYSLPAGQLGDKACIGQTVIGTVTGNNAGVLTLRAKYGAGVATAIVTPAAVTDEYFVAEVSLCGDGATNAQQLVLRSGAGNTVLLRGDQTTIAVDSTAPQTLEVTAQWGTATSALSVSKLYAQTGTGGTAVPSTPGLADPGANGLIKRTSLNTTAVAVAGTDYVIPSGSITGNAATATALAANGTNAPAGLAITGVDAQGNAEGQFDVATQAELNAFVPATATALAADGNNAATGFAIIGVDAQGNAQGAFDVATQVELDAKVPNTALALAANGTNAAAGNAILGVDAQGNAEGAFDVATQTELDTHTNLTTAHGATATPTASRILLATGTGEIAGGWLPLPTVSTRGAVLSGGNCDATTGKQIGVGLDGLPVCATDQNSGTGSGVTAGNKGDITVSLAPEQWLINPAAVTNAKLATMAEATLKGRVSVGTGAPEDLTPAQVRLMLNVADGANNYVHPNHTGDVTSVGDGATTIAAGVVTNAKLANMATATFKGRTTAGTGSPEDLTATQATAMLNLFTISTKGLVPLSGGGTTNFLRADGTWAAPPGGGGSGGSLQASCDLGCAITSAEDVDTAVRLGGLTDYFLFYKATMAAQPAQDMKFIAGDNFTIRYLDNAEAPMLVLDEATKVATFAVPPVITTGQTKSIVWDAGAMSTDGTNCATPTEQILNSGAKRWAFSCADSNASVFYGSVIMPDAWNGGTVTFELSLFHGTSEAITFAGDFSAQCRGPNEAIDNTWGTAVADNVAITTANNYVNNTSGLVTPNGGCAAGDLLTWRYVVNSGTFSTNAANSRVLAVKMEYGANATTD